MNTQSQVVASNPSDSAAVLVHEGQMRVEFGMIPTQRETIISPGSEEFSAAFREGRNTPRGIILMVFFPLLVTIAFGVVLAML